MSDIEPHSQRSDPDPSRGPTSELGPGPSPTILGVVILGPRNEIRGLSAGAADLLGLDQNAVGSEFLERAPEYIPLGVADLARAHDGGGLQREMHDTDGNAYLIDLAPLAMASEQPAGADAMGRVAVTFLSLNELIQQRSRGQRLARMMDASPEMIAGLDGAYRVRTWNRGAQDLLGHPSAAVLGQPLRELIARGHRRRFDSLCRRAHDGATATADSIVVRTAAGREVTLLLSMTPVPGLTAAGAAPHHIAVACFGRDVTRRRQMETDLREREERLSDLYDHAPDLHASIDPTTRLVTECNQTLLDTLSLQRDAVIGQPAALLCTADSIAELGSCIERIGNREVRDVRMSLRMSDGSSLAASLNMSARTDESGAVRSCRAVWRDVRKLERTEAELREEVRRRERFLAMLSHELRNPLNAVTAASAVLERTADTESQPLLNTLTRQTSHLRRLLDDLLDVSRVTQDKLALDRETVDLRGPVRSAIEATAPFAEEQSVEIDAEFPGDPVWVHGDCDRLQQVASNLINNGIKFADVAAGRVEVRLGQTGDEAELRVSDNGPGVAGALKDSVFDLFVQSEATLDRSQGGLGVGLTLVRSLVDHHDGTVAIESGNRLGGADFVVRLPTAVETPTVLTDSVGPQEVPVLRVLVVEDLDGARQALVALLEMDGHVVEAAEDGGTAVAAAERFVPDLLICDIGLPGLDGYEVIRRLRESVVLEKMKAVALTGYGAPDDIEEARRAGFDDHLTKPLRPERLDAALRRLFATT